MKKILPAIAALFIYFSGQAQSSSGKITVDFNRKGAEIGSMYGVFFEEIGHAGEGGINPELLRNRSFEDNILVANTTYKNGYMLSPHLKNYDTARTSRYGGYSDFAIKFDTSALQGWRLEVSGNARVAVRQTVENPLFPSAPHNLKLTIAGAEDRHMVSLINSGFSGIHYHTNTRPYRYTVYNEPESTPPYGIAFKKNAAYNLRIILKANTDYEGNIVVRLLDSAGNVIGRQLLPVKNKKSWQNYRCQVRPDSTVPNGRFSLGFDSPGTVWVDFVSLVPAETFNGRTNGLRKDIASVIDSLKPAFIRWPGGCIVEGFTLSNRFKWKETLGDPAGRPGEFDLWGYHNSYGFGYHEFLQYCEDTGAAGMFVCNVGMSCLYRNGDYCSRDEVAYYIQDALDAIEYALGDASTKWGAKRIAAGHPAPFPLKYIEVGNENRYEEYSKRYDLFYKAIKTKYPRLVVISNYGIDEADACAAPGRPVDMIDPHWYESPDFFFAHHHLFDSVKRNAAYKLYVGEYSANQHVGYGNLEGALSEAVFAMGMERNSDMVKMCSYAPLLQHDDDNTWPVNLIRFNTDQVYGRSSYYVQQMLSTNKPDVNLNVAFSSGREGTNSQAQEEVLRHYCIAGYDRKTNEIIIKVVNGGPLPFESTIDLKNAGQLAGNAWVIVLTAQSKKEENSFAEPEKVSPKTSVLKIEGVSFNYEFKPFSFTVLRIKRA